MIDVIIDFLKPLDQFENALKFVDNMSEDVKNWVIGFKMILNQFYDVFSNRGILSYDAKSMFDPHYHEAIEVVETDDHAPGTIIHQFARGYKMGDNVIRPARVKVSKLPSCDENVENVNSKDNASLESDDH